MVSLLLVSGVLCEYKNYIPRSHLTPPHQHTYTQLPLNVFDMEDEELEDLRAEGNEQWEVRYCAEHKFTVMAYYVLIT